MFKGYNTTELANSSSVKAVPPNYQASNNLSLSSLSAKQKLTKVKVEDERERKKKKNEKKSEVRAQKAKEQNESRRPGKGSPKGVPERHTREILHPAEGVAIIGPATVGGIEPGCFRIGNSGG